MSEKKDSQVSQEQSEELSDEQLESVAGGVGLPPSGDSNPSDLGNTTVDTSDTIDPHAK